MPDGPPPDLSGHHGKWRRLLAPLVADPKVWYRVMGPTSPGSARRFAWMLSAGRIANIEADEYEATSRNEDGQGYVYARYVGGQS